MTDSNRGSKDTQTYQLFLDTPIVPHVAPQTLQDEATSIPLHIAMLDIGAKTAASGSEELNQTGLNQTKNLSVSKGRKDDGGKPRWDLLDADFLDGTAAVLEFGSRKYDAHNWRAGIRTSRLLAALGRHYGAILRGEDIDPESGFSHAYHISCCIMFFSWMIKYRPDLDDRYKYAIY